VKGDSARRGAPDKSLQRTDQVGDMKTQIVIVNDLMQQNYSYSLTAPVGRSFAAEFTPELSPQEMLELGVFGGKYMTDCRDEFPASWFIGAKLCHEKHDPKLNYFGLNASQPLSVWREKGWIYYEDPRGWFQWYCRYYMGRRCPDDERQIKRWRGVRRHIVQIEKHCKPGDMSCRPKQRQALLNWAYDSREI
jgi:hypothetical protein